MSETRSRVGPVGQRAAQALTLLRKRRGLTKLDLSRRLADLGRPLNDDLIRRIENGERRVDVDELVALALALEVTPNFFLLPAGVDGRAELTPTVTAPTGNAWKWACGDRTDPLGSPETTDPQAVLERDVRFKQENRPHDPFTALFARVGGDLIEMKWTDRSELGGLQSGRSDSPSGEEDERQS